MADMPLPRLSRVTRRAYTPVRRRRVFLSLLARGVPPCGAAVWLSFNTGPAPPLEQGLIFSSAPQKPAVETFAFWSKTLTYTCTRCIADMSVATLPERLDAHIFSLSLRSPAESSSLGPAGLPTRTKDRTSSLGLGPNGRRRFLLPRPFSTTFVGLHLRMEPLFLLSCVAPSTNLSPFCAWLAFRLRVCRTRPGHP